MQIPLRVVIVCNDLNVLNRLRSYLSEAMERLEPLERTDPRDERSPWDLNALNVAKRLNGWNDWNGYFRPKGRSHEAREQGVPPIRRYREGFCRRSMLSAPAGERLTIYYRRGPK